MPQIFEALAQGAAVLPLLGEVDTPAERRGGGDLGDLGDLGELGELELIECAALIAEPGCEHQGTHADYRRFLSKGELPKSARMPPRLVAFLYLQDTPSAEWGATHFLPGTSTAQAHSPHPNPHSNPHPNPHSNPNPSPSPNPIQAHSRFFEAGETGQAEVHLPSTPTPTPTPTSL